jgi:regulator of replication initiation timing
MGYADEIGVLRGVELLREVAADLRRQNAELRLQTTRLLEWNSRLRTENQLIRAALGPGQATGRMLQAKR